MGRTTKSLASYLLFLLHPLLTLHFEHHSISTPFERVVFHMTHICMPYIFKKNSHFFSLEKYYQLLVTKTHHSSKRKSFHWLIIQHIIGKGGGES